MIFLYLYLINLYIRPQDWLPFLYAWPVDYLVLIPALIFGFILQASEDKPLVKNPQYGLLFLLLVIIFLSNAVHGNFSFGIDQFIKFFKKMCIFVVALLMVKSTNKLKWATFFIILLSSFIAYQSIEQFLSGSSGWANQGFYHNEDGVRTKWVGLWDGANITALLLNVSVPFALEFVFGPYPLYWRIPNVILGACLIGGIYTTNSRGGFVTLLATLFLYPIFRYRKKVVSIMMGVFLAGLIFLCLAPSRSAEISTDEESAHVRTRLWGNAMDMFKENKLLGVGKGKFSENTSRNLIAHSNFMQNLGEIGGIGIFVWIALIYFSFKGLYYANRVKPPPGREGVVFKSLVRAILISMISFNICTLFITMEIDLFYLLLGLCAVAVNIMNRKIQPIELRFELKDVRNILAIIVLLLLFYHYFTR